MNASKENDIETNSYSVNCFDQADAIATSQGDKWDLSHEEEFDVFETHYWICKLGEAIDESYTHEH